MSEKLNFVFWGTPDVASETLEILKQKGYIPSLIVTSPDKPKGRKMLVTPPPVKVWAEKNNIQYLQPENQAELLRIFISRGSHSGGEGRREEKFEEAEPTFDFFIVVAYGKIIPENILNMPKLGSINIHYSLLPKYRGASPVESAILNGDTETGVTIQKMKFKIDAGDIIAQEKVNILPDEKAPDLRKRLIKIGGELLVKILPEFTSGKIKKVAQNENEATFCQKIKKEDGLVDLNGNAIKNYNKFRAYTIWPRTFFLARRSLGEGGFQMKRIIITDAVLENNPLDKARGKLFIIKRVLPEGKKEISYDIFNLRYSVD
jgi:methionyl-tRNA formyltransferase